MRFLSNFDTRSGNISNGSVCEEVIHWLHLLSVGTFGPDKEADCVCAICETFKWNLGNFGSLLPSVNPTSEPLVGFGNFLNLNKV